jgi:hypothetical protein
LFRRDKPRSPVVLAPVAAGLRLNQTKEARRNAPIRKQNFRFSPLSVKNAGECQYIDGRGQAGTSGRSRPECAQMVFKFNRRKITGLVAETGVYDFLSPAQRADITMSVSVNGRKYGFIVHGPAAALL